MTIKRIIRYPELREITSLSRSTIFRMARNGEFPQAVKLSANSVGWRSHDIDVWMKNLETSNGKMGNRAMNLPLDRTCVFCGNEYTCSPEGRNQRYCRRKCRTDYHKLKIPDNVEEKKECKHCKEEFNAQPEGKNRKYCSDKCRSNAHIERQKKVKGQ